MTEKTIEHLREELRQAELLASVAEALRIAAENDKRAACDRLAVARLDLQLAEEMKRGEA
jgi:hypothetical protein